MILAGSSSRLLKSLRIRLSAENLFVTLHQKLNLGRFTSRLRPRHQLEKSGSGWIRLRNTALRNSLLTSSKALCLRKSERSSRVVGCLLKNPSTALLQKLQPVYHLSADPYNRKKQKKSAKLILLNVPAGRIYPR